jgi:hypothetical protein
LIFLRTHHRLTRADALCACIQLGAEQAVITSRGVRREHATGLRITAVVGALIFVRARGRDAHELAAQDVVTGVMRTGIVISARRRLAFALPTDTEVSCGAGVAIVTGTRLERIYAAIVGVTIVDGARVVVITVFDDSWHAGALGVADAAFCADVSIIALNVRGHLVHAPRAEDAAVYGAGVLVIAFIGLAGDTDSEEAGVACGADLTVITGLIFKGEVLTEPLLTAVTRAIVPVVTSVYLSRDTHTAGALIAPCARAPVAARERVIVGVDAFP